jgi:glutamine synthetase adenylyltransferase
VTDLFTHWIDVVHMFMGADIPMAASAEGGVFHYKDGRTAPDTINVLNQYPQAFDRVMRMLAASRWASDYLAQHPILLDELLDERLLEREPDWSAWSTAVRHALDAAGDDQERQMNLLRDAHHAQVLRLLVADLEGVLTV